MKTVNDFYGFTDSDRIEAAIAGRKGNVVVIPPRQSDIEPERDYWLIDRAILIPENTTILLKNCKIKLSDRCRDNFFRSANCGPGIEDIEIIRNIHLRGEGLCILEGADHPRATGDSSKAIHCPCPRLPEDIVRLADWVPEERLAVDKLDFWDIHNHSYGTDAGKEGEVQHGDWRGIGILFACVENFSIENLRIVDSHGWGVSLEECAYGRVEKLDFDACMGKTIDGLLSNMENQDGIDLRNGCHDITITDITGGTGDDLIALTAIAREAPVHPSGTFESTHIMHNDWSKRETGIHDIIIRNVKGYSKAGICKIIRLLPADAKIWNVVIDGVIDAAPAGMRNDGVLLLGEGDGAYGKNLPDGLTGVTISNVICNSKHTIIVAGYLKDSAIMNVVNRNPDCPVIEVHRKGGLNNVATCNLVSAGNTLIKEFN